MIPGRQTLETGRPGQAGIGTVRSPTRRAQALVELAIVLPILLLLISAVVDFARVYNAQCTLDRCTRAAVNYGAMMRSALTLPSKDDVKEKLLSSIVSPLATSSVRINSIEVNRADPDGGGSVVVDASYEVPLLTPGISALFSRGLAVVSSRAQRPYLSGMGQVASASPPSHAPAPPPFSISSTNDLVININCSARLKVLTKRVPCASKGGAASVTTKLSTNGTSFFDMFGGNPLTGNEDMILSSLLAGSKVAIQAKAFAPGCINATYRSNAKNPFADCPTAYHQYVLASGDSLPQTPGFRGLSPLEPLLTPFVDTASSRVSLRPKEAAVLFEFSPAFSSAEADFQDLALLFQFYDPATESPPMTP